MEAISRTEAELDCLPEDKPFILTDSGRQIFFETPDPEEMDIEDVAWGLARESRFGGQTRRDRLMYSAGQHSVYSSWLSPSRFARQALLHETSEGLGMKDVPAPLKSLLPGYKDIEQLQMNTAAQRFGFAWPMAPEVKQIDLVLRSTEKRDLMTHGHRIWSRNLPDPLPFIIVPWPEQATVRAFLGRWAMLQTGRCEVEAELEFQKPLLPLEVRADLIPTVLPDHPFWPAIGYTDERTAEFVRGCTGSLLCPISLTPLTPEQPRLFHLLDVLSCIRLLIGPTGMQGVRRVMGHLLDFDPYEPGDFALSHLQEPARVELFKQHPHLEAIAAGLEEDASPGKLESILVEHGPLITICRARNN